MGDPLSGPGTRFTKISAESMPCMRKGFRASTVATNAFRLCSGMGDIARANVFVRRSYVGVGCPSVAKMVR